MALNNGVVQITAGLACSQLSAPPIGTGTQSFSTGFTDGDPAQDKYVQLSTSPTALNTDLGGTGFIMINNPSSIDVTIKVGTTTIGTLKGVSSVESGSKPCVFPIDTGVIINAVAASGTPTIGVTIIKTTPGA